MNPIIKNGIFPIIWGLLAYLLITFINKGNLIPAQTEDFITLAVLIVACFLSARLASIQPPRRSRNRPAKRSRRQEPSKDLADIDLNDKNRETGTVKWFNLRKGYGFITRDQGDDVFVHLRDLHIKGRQAVSEGERVSYVVVSADKGPQAEKVTVI